MPVSSRCLADALADSRPAKNFRPRALIGCIPESHALVICSGSLKLDDAALLRPARRDSVRWRTYDGKVILYPAAMETR